VAVHRREWRGARVGSGTLSSPTSNQAEGAALRAPGPQGLDEKSPRDRSQSLARPGEDRARRRLDARWIAYGLLVLSVLGVVLAFAPGLISHDTNSTLWEARTGFVRDWWAPFGSLIFDAAFDLGIGLGLVFVVQTALVVAGLYLCLRLILRRVPAAFGAAVICAFPPMYAQLSNLSRDSFYIGSTLLAIGLMGRAVTSEGSSRAIAVGLALLASIGAFLWRPNAVATIVPLVTALTYLALVDPSWRPSRFARFHKPRGRTRALLAAGIVGCFAALILVAATQGSYRALGVVATHPERHIFLYDLAAISTETDRNAFPSELPRRRPGRLGVTPVNITLPALERKFDYSNAITLYGPNDNYTRGLNDPRVAEREVKTLRDGWWDALSAEPGAYLANRLKLVASQLGFDHRPTDAFYGLVEPTNWGHPIEFVNGFNAASDYVLAFVGPDSAIALDLIWPYLLIATICIAYLWRRLGRLITPLVIMVATVWLGLAVLAALAMGSSFRYAVITVPIALVLLMFSVAVAGAQRRWGEVLLERPVVQAAAA
jgi:hypothetical protein